jgi:hypothetical protein
MSTPKLLLVMLLWAVYIVQFVRVFRQQRGNPQFRFTVWWMFFLACVAFTFTGKDVEEATDALFRGLPISLYIKYFAMTQGIRLYFDLLHSVHPLPTQTFHRLHWLHSVSLWGGILSFIIVALLDVGTHPEIRYYVNAARDVVVAVYLLMGLIPVNRYLIGQETVPTMRFKLALNLLFCITYVTVAMSSLISLVVVMFRLGDVERLLPLFLPLTYVVYALFLAALVPHRWIAVLLFPGRLYTYSRLQKLCHVLQLHTGTAVPFKPMPVRVLSLGALEIAIYQTMIVIFDLIAQMRDEGHHDPLVQQLIQFTAVDHDYEDTLRGLRRLSHG